MTEKIGKVSNPLTVIAIFAGLAEIALTVSLGLVEKDYQSIFLWFVMIFPCILVVLFYLTLNFNHRVLYAPSDFEEEENFMRIAAVHTKTAIVDGQKVLSEAQKLFTDEVGKAMKALSEVDRSKDGPGEWVPKEEFLRRIESLNSKFNSINQDLEVARRTTARFTVGPTGRSILGYILDRVGQPTTKEIADKFSLSKNAAHLELRDLEEQGLVVRGLSPNDKKEYVWDLGDGHERSGPVAIKLDGVLHNGTFTVRDGLVEVTDWKGRSKSTQVGGSPPEVIAKILLTELVSKE